MTTLLAGNLITVGCKMIWVMTVYAWVILPVQICDIIQELDDSMNVIDFKIGISIISHEMPIKWDS